MKYAIWNKVDPIITPTGAVFTAEQWMERYPVARLDSITILCAKGEINGALFATLGQVVEQYDGVLDFSGCETAQDKLDLIETYEAEKKAAAKLVQTQPTAEERIAAALEYQVMASLPDDETV